jgi:DNA repair exonuclease SbcCD ATPase subunit
MIDEKQALSEGLVRQAEIITKLQRDLHALRTHRNEQSARISFLEERLKTRVVLESRAHSAERRVRELEAQVKRLSSEKKKLAQLWPEYPQYFNPTVGAPVLYATGKKRKRRRPKQALDTGGESGV